MTSMTSESSESQPNVIQWKPVQRWGFFALKPEADLKRTEERERKKRKRRTEKKKESSCHSDLFKDDRRCVWVWVWVGGGGG